MMKNARRPPLRKVGVGRFFILVGRNAVGVHF